MGVGAAAAMTCHGIAQPARARVRRATARAATARARQGRTFGVEIEIVGMRGQRAADVLSTAGVQAIYEGYNHRQRNHWKVVTDSSVSGAGGSCEVVSPILSGDAGMLELAKALRALEDAGAQVNRSCGIHVHIGARDISAAAFKRIVVEYAKYERTIDGFMPRSRRGSENTYCRGAGSNLESRLAGVDTISGLRQRLTNRFVKVNVQSFMRHGTIEFRHHAGTVNETKVVNWVKLLMALFEKCVAEVAPTNYTLEGLLEWTGLDADTRDYFVLRSEHFVTQTASARTRAAAASAM